MARAQPDHHALLEMVHNFLERNEDRRQLTWIKSAILLKCGPGYSEQKRVLNHIQNTESKVIQMLDVAKTPRSPY